MAMIRSAASEAALATNTGSPQRVLGSASAPVPATIASVGCANAAVSSSASVMQATGMCSVPSFVSCFSPIASTSSSSTNSTPVENEEFVVGPGFSPIPVKLVQQIISGKFVDLSDLIAANLAELEREPQVMFDGKLIVNAQRKNKRKIDDITAWCEAFSIYMLIVVSYFPNRWRDLMAYKLLILRMYRQFKGRVWLSYDKAFRQHASAAKLYDWSRMDNELFNFHAA